MTQLIQTVLHQYLTYANPLWLLFLGAWLTFGFMLTLVVAPAVPRAVALVLVGCLVGALAGGYYLIVKNPERQAAATRAVIQLALEQPGRVSVEVRTVSDEVVLETLPQTPGEVERLATLPMDLVARLERTLPPSAASEVSPLQRDLGRVLEAGYDWPEKPYWIGVLCLLGLWWQYFEIGKGLSDCWRRGDRFVWVYAGLIAVPVALWVLYGFLAVRAKTGRQTLACEPVAAAVTKAFTARSEVGWTETDGTLTLIAIVPRPFLGRTGDLTVVTTIAPELRRQLDAIGAKYGYAPLGQPEPHP